MPQNTAWATIDSAVGKVIGRMSNGKLQLVIELGSEPSQNGRADVLVRGRGWTKLDNVIGEGYSINLCVTRFRVKSRRGGKQQDDE